MKKFLALAALVLGLASCQTEPEGLGVVTGGEVDTVVTVSLPAATRATNSAEGAFANVDLSGDATIRYILKIYQKVGNEYVASNDRQVEYSDEKSVVFPVRLVPNRDYRFVVWADYVEGEADVDYHYNTADLTKIELNGEWNPMDETRDAFTGYFDTAVEGQKYTGASSINIALTRPFAKLRVITTDMEQLNDLGIEPKTATVEYTVAHYNAFNAFAGEAIGDSKNRNIKHENFTIKAYGDNVDNESMVLFTDYFFANNDVVKFNLTVVDQKGAVIDDTIAFTTDINVKRNHLTTIIGDILTDGNNINVEVDDEFAAETFYLEGDVTLTEDLTIDRPLVVRAGAKAVLNLNGKSIINTTNSETFGEGEGIIVYGELDIVGEGTVKGSTMAVWARGNGGNAVVNIYGGTFEGCAEGFAKGGRSVIYASSNNTINIYGGSVKALSVDTTSYNRASAQGGLYAALNIADNNGMINVYGGSFYKQNPAAPLTEPTSWDTTHPNGFVAEGYGVFENGEWFKVLYTGGESTIAAVVNNADQLNAAMAQGGVIILAEGNFGTIVAKSNVTLVGTPEAKVDCVALNDASNFTVRNITFDAATAKYFYDVKGNSKGVANIVSYLQSDYTKTATGGNIVIDGCTFNGTFTNGGEAIGFGNQGRTPYGKVTIKNCTFNIIGAYYHIYGHYFGMNDLVIENNVFNSEVLYPTIYLGRYQSNMPVVIKNNTFKADTSLENAVAYQAHGASYTVSIDASGNTFAE